MDVFAAIFALQIQQLHHDVVRIGVMDLALEKHNAVFQQQIAERQLALTLVALVRVTVGNLVSHAIVSQWEIHTVSFERDGGRLRRFVNVEALVFAIGPKLTRADDRTQETGVRRQERTAGIAYDLLPSLPDSWFLSPDACSINGVFWLT